MRLRNTFFLFLIVPLLAGPLLAVPLLCGADTGQVYQSKDANGNTVFSDMPSAGAEVIKVAPTNSADPVQDIPALAAPDKSDDKKLPVTKLTRSGSDDEHVEESPYWIGGGGDSDNIDDARLDRDSRRDTPITERPRVNPLPTDAASPVARPAARTTKGGSGRR